MAYRVIQWATGAVGSLALKEIIRHPDLELVGVLVYSEEKEGKDAGELVGLDPTGVLATRSREEILALEADCVIHAPLAPSMEELDADVTALLASGKNVISTAGYFAPDFRGPELVAKLEKACAAGNSTIYGGGIEPGFMFDRLVPTLTGMCADIGHIRLFETIDAARHPAVVMLVEALGIGKPLDQVTSESPFTQYFTAMFFEVATAFGHAIGLQFDRLEPGFETAAATHDLEIAVGRVADGTVAGSKYTVKGFFEGRHLLTLDVHWFVERGLADWPVPADRYQWGAEIEGRPSARMVVDVLPTLGTGGDQTEPGFVAAAATAVLAVPGVCEAPAGIFHPPVFAPWRPHSQAVAVS
jgi:hypothetical protein